MRTPSVYVAEVLMPYLRAKIAERLYREGIKQAKIADYLGITQAMVSKYLSGKYRAPPELGELLDDIADEVTRVILFGGSREDVIVVTSRRILELFREGLLCKYYAEYAGVREEACTELFSASDEARLVLDSLRDAIRALQSVETFSDLIPEVRSNFAYAMPSPRSSSEVAAIPGRITSVRGKLFALPPEFGVSRFTAGILVELAKLRPEIRSVINLRYGEDVENALSNAGFKFARVHTGGLGKEDAIREIVRPFKTDLYDAVIDEGGEGVEPLVYVFGKDPLEVVDKIKRLLKNL